MSVRAAQTQLRRLSDLLAGPSWAQGAGGNASVKLSDRMLIKASGMRLEEMGREGALSEVPLGLLAAALGGDAGAEAQILERVPRPSMELWMHAFAAPVVIHTHPPGVVAFGCLRATDGRTPDDEGAALPYVRPGRALAEVLTPLVLAGHRTIVLQNHGLLVMGDDADEMVARMHRVEAAARKSVGLDDEPERRTAEALALPAQTKDGLFVRRFETRPATASEALFPDAALYLPRFICGPEGLSSAWERVRSAGCPSAIVVTDDGERHLVATSAQRLVDATETLVLHDLLEEIGGTAALRRLPEGEGAALGAMPAERHRLGLRGAGSAA